MSVVEKEYTRRYFLTAGECNPQAVMPVTLLASKVIEVATFHANDLGVGYARLVADGLAWVLSRLSVDMERWPGVNEEYSVTTWIENFNRHFSERNFEITDASGARLGGVRSVWMAINVRERRAADIEMLGSLRESISSKVCPVERMTRFLPVADGDALVGNYRFRYCDCDFNRHVNTLRYIELMLNQWDMAYFDSHEVKRFDIAFMHEARFGTDVEVRIADAGDSVYNAEIAGGDEVFSRARIAFRDKKFDITI